MGDERKLVFVRLNLGRCPVCKSKFVAEAEVPFPLSPEEKKELLDTVHSRAEDKFEKHFAYHAEEISDSEACPDCLLLPKGHRRCTEPDCVCPCVLET